MHSDGDLALAEIEVRTLGSAGHGQTVTCVEEKHSLSVYISRKDHFKVTSLSGPLPTAELVEIRETKN